MNNFRLVILDYAKQQLDNPLVRKILGDLIVVKQKNFERTDPDYVVMDKHDMIGTHVLIYETTDLFEPKLIFTVRLTYESRAVIHKLKTPVQELMPLINEKYQLALNNFIKKHNSLIECNSLFLDPDFSSKKIGIKLTDIGFALVYLLITRMGQDHFVGCPNIKYKTHRFVENIGSFEKDYIFTHPNVPDPHMLIMLENFNTAYIQSIFVQHKSLFENSVEIARKNEHSQSLSETIHNAFVSISADRLAG